MSATNTTGKPSRTIRAYPVSECKFNGVTTLADLISFGVLRPNGVETSKVNERLSNDILRSTYKLRGEIQRKFNKQRRINAEKYARYLLQIRDDPASGGCPAITLYSAFPMTMDKSGALAHVPLGTTLIAVDGETQLDGRFILAELEPESVHDTFAVTVYHNIDTNVARRIMAIYATRAAPVKGVVVGAGNDIGAASLFINNAVGDLISGYRIGKGFHVPQDHLTSELGLASVLVGCVAPDMVYRNNGINRARDAMNSQFGCVPGLSGVTEQCLRDVVQAMIDSKPEPDEENTGLAYGKLFPPVMLATLGVYYRKYNRVMSVQEIAQAVELLNRTPPVGKSRFDVMCAGLGLTELPARVPLEEKPWLNDWQQDAAE